ncbi:DUF4870 family protein [Mesorhizobium sp. 1B3]|uniref:DUF4870 family protein n=1 Tax=Mesorhizobium sp. 1B3 TaxID=3243599 RepID=UPI003D960839
MSESTVTLAPATENKILAYVADALMFFFPLAGVVIAYIDRPKASPMVASHYTYLIGTFWKSLLLTVVNILLSFVLIGLFTAVATGIWYLVRTIKSLVLLSRNEPIAKPSTWWI